MNKTIMETPEEKRRRQQEDSYTILKWAIKYGLPILVIGFIIHYFIEVLK